MRFQPESPRSPLAVVVTAQDDVGRVVVDGFHRTRVGKESRAVRQRVHGYVPVVQIRESQV